MTSVEQADTLRTVGRFLEEKTAVNVQIVNQEGFLRVAWQGTDGVDGDRTFSDDELAKRRRRAQGYRWGLPDNEGTLQELLRTLGQLADEERIEIGTITRHGDGWSLTGTIERRYVTRGLLDDELKAVSAERRRMRAPDDTATAIVPADPFSLVTPGSPVFTADGQYLGTVKQIVGRSFQVRASLRQHDYWLGAEHVSAAARHQRVELSIPGTDVPRFRMTEPR